MKKNYILLLLIIIVGVFIMTSIGFIYQKVDNSKENKSYISKKVNNYEYKELAKKGDTLKTVSVTKGVKETAELVIESDCRITNKKRSRQTNRTAS